MKKVLALVLAVVMVCTMAMAVSVSGVVIYTDPSASTSANAGFEAEETLVPGAAIIFTVDELFGANYYYETVKYNSNNVNKFMPANNKVTVTFSRGADLVASQGWVRISRDPNPEAAANEPLTKDDYRYIITLKDDTSKVVDDVIDLAISKVSVKATGKLANDVYKPASSSVKYAVAGTYKLCWNVGYAKGELTIGGTTQAPTVDLNTALNQGTVYTVKKGTNPSDNAELKTGHFTSTGIGGLSGVITLNAGDTYFVKGACATSAVVADILYKNKIITANNFAIADKFVAWNTVGGVDSTLTVKYTLTDAKATYNAYAIAADGKTITKLAATLDDGVLSFTAPGQFVVVVDGTLPATATAGTSTGTTTNPGTGANDVVGVAAALAVVALVSGAAISLKK